MNITYAFCTYNRGDRLSGLVSAMRTLRCSSPFEILAINNNSMDKTPTILNTLSKEQGANLRIVTEHKQGIVHARNRAIEESLGSDVLVFIDDDELPDNAALEAVHDAVVNEGADCVGGKIVVDFRGMNRPPWLDDELAGFLGQLDYGPTPFWIEDAAYPIWSGNIAYRMDIFRNHPDLRFDLRYNRAGDGVGGGEDAMMFRELLGRNYRIRYRPDMCVTHAVDIEKLRKKYFLHLHYLAGVRKGRHELPAYDKKIAGIPPFLLRQLLIQGMGTLTSGISGKRYMRKAMNAAHTLGMIVGARLSSKHGE